MAHKYLKNVATLKLEKEKCIACGMCLTVCPHEVFVLENKKVKIAKFNSCMECGACGKNCPTAAIDVKPGVGCAYAIIIGKITGTEPNCDCSGGNSGCC